LSYCPSSVVKTRLIVTYCKRQNEESRAHGGWE